MPPPAAEPPLICRVRTQRERLHLRPSELAQQCGMTRQALHSIETGAYVPNTLVALRLARALGCRVEELFRLPDPSARARLIGPEVPAGTRVQLAWVGERLLAFPLPGERGWGQPADGTITSDEAGPEVDVQLYADQTLARRTAVLIGCDPSLGVAASHVARQTPDARLLWSAASSLEALKALKRGEAHAAGIHLWDAGTASSNLPFVRRELPGQPVHLYTLWSWEQGLLVARGNPHGIRGAADLVGGRVRLANREPGSGSRLLLDAWLSAMPLSVTERRQLPGYDLELGSHLEVAAQVASGRADVAPGPRSAAMALGLDFVPLQRERFDLVVPQAHLEHPAIAALLRVAQAPAFRAEIASLGGYDPAHAGELWQTTG
ncbi:substrate-binding domain-containing protein [Deinococcus sonorensis]|uniref:Substrate-binding domain-containing protein n=2 Tax=Deinococcus sonorensis TaxID=309891 RepID=A0AAU7UFP8_9DEIO